MNRGAYHRDIFQHDADCEVFLDALALVSSRFDLEVHAYCLMSNHFHLLMRSREGHLSAGMQFLLGRFTRLVNVRVGRDGPLFRGRYASVLLSADDHIAQVARYIHLNPVSAGLARVAEAWRWSSAAAYISAVRSPSWLKRDSILDFFGPTDHIARYRDFMTADTHQDSA